MKRKCNIVAFALILFVATACEILDNDPDKHVKDNDSTYVGLEEVAEIFALIPLESSQLDEVHTAVTSSSSNGYDEEYTMRDLFESPGAGVGESQTRSGGTYERPLRDLIKEHVQNRIPTRAGAEEMDPDMFLSELENSDIQIYWPFSDRWNGKDLPVITYDPEDGSEKNFGYRLVMEDDGSRRVEEVVVDEEMAMAEPVWVINRNSDAGYATLEMLRREHPDWGEGGGTIIVRPSDQKSMKTRGESAVKALVLKDFTMNRSYDSWFAGASEFFVKTGYVGDLTAMTEAELRIYNPEVTDFMIVVKRSQIGVPQDFNALLMTDWHLEPDYCAFMITEDDGGTRTEWTSKAKVYVAGKSYGFEITIPMNTRDDVVWRGKLSHRWLEANSNLVGHFGDVDLTFEVVEY